MFIDMNLLSNNDSSFGRGKVGFSTQAARNAQPGNFPLLAPSLQCLWNAAGKSGYKCGRLKG